MNGQRKLILISNDDGVNAEGLRLLVQTVAPLADVVVLAPEEQQSGKSSAVTAGAKVKLRCVSKQDGLEVYAANGTPVDCVKLAFYTVCRDRKPDLLLAGINKGSNSSISVIYSGTMGVALEGCVNGIPSVGLSQCFVTGEPICYSHGLPLVKQMVEDLLSGRLELPSGVCLNVNFPHGPITGGLQWCRQARGKWVNEYSPVQSNKPEEAALYELGGEYLCQDDATDTDEYVLAHGGAACVPQAIDMTAAGFLEKMKTNK